MSFIGEKVKRVKKREGENLTDANIKKIISLLNASPAITKKEACNILNISYNTTRLNNIIQQYQDKIAFQKKRRAQKRGVPASNQEIAEIAGSYLAGESFSDIAKSVFRSVAFVKNIVQKIGVPHRAQGDEKKDTELLPDDCVGESFEVGEIAWSAKYHTSCEVMAKLDEVKYETYGNCYRVWIREGTESSHTFGGFNAFVPAYDLGKLEHLKEYGLDTKRI